MPDMSRTLIPHEGTMGMVWGHLVEYRQACILVFFPEGNVVLYLSDDWDRDVDPFREYYSDLNAAFGAMGRWFRPTHILGSAECMACRDLRVRYFAFRMAD